MTAMIKRRKLTNAELAPIVADYHAAFPSWHVAKSGDILFRRNGPIAQVIWFDRLRTGMYRPTCRVHVLTAPDAVGGTVVLPQFLGAMHKEISPEAHPKVFPRIVDALQTEIAPPISQPLDAVHVAEILCSRAAGRPAAAYALSTLWGFLGYGDKAILWIRQYHDAMRALGLPPQPSDLSRDAFLDRLEGWIRQSSCTVELTIIMEQEVVKLQEGP